MAPQHRQLPLLVQLRDDATLENFLAGPATAPLLGVLERQRQVAPVAGLLSPGR